MLVYKDWKRSRESLFGKAISAWMKAILLYYVEKLGYTINPYCNPSTRKDIMKAVMTLFSQQDSMNHLMPYIIGSDSLVKLETLGRKGHCTTLKKGGVLRDRELHAWYRLVWIRFWDPCILVSSLVECGNYANRVGQEISASLLNKHVHSSSTTILFFLQVFICRHVVAWCQSLQSSSTQHLGMSGTHMDLFLLSCFIRIFKVQLGQQQRKQWKQS